MKQEMNGKKFYEKKWFAVLMTIILAPIGIYFLWKYHHFSKRPRIVFSSFFLIIFIIVLFSEDDISEVVEPPEIEAEQSGLIEEEDSLEMDETEDEIDDEIEVEEKVEKEIEKEELYMELISSTYNKDEDKISLKVETNFAEDVEVDVGFYDTAEEFIVPMIVSSGKINSGKLLLDIYHMENDSLLSFILNGDYYIRASLSTYDDESLLATYKSYDHFLENFELKDGVLEEVDSGFKIEEIHLGEMEITDAHTLEEYDKVVFEEDKGLYDALDYAQLRKNPNGHAGEFVYYTGEIIQIMEEVDFTIIRLAVTETPYGYDSNDIIWVEYDANTEYIDGDIVTIYGMLLGSHNYTSQAGWDISVPAMLADWIE